MSKNTKFKPLSLVYEESIRSILYHGSGMDFGEFKSNSTPATGIAHHGYGIYLINDPNAAIKYIKQYAIGAKGWLYTVKLSSNCNIVEWDSQIPLNEFMDMADEIMDIDDDLYQEMKDYPDGYNGETFTYGELYDILKHVQGFEIPNEFFEDYGIDGFYGPNRMSPDATEYCIFDPSQIKIIDKKAIYAN